MGGVRWRVLEKSSKENKDLKDKETKEIMTSMKQDKHANTLLQINLL